MPPEACKRKRDCHSDRINQSVRDIVPSHSTIYFRSTLMEPNLSQEPFRSIGIYEHLTVIAHSGLHIQRKILQLLRPAVSHFLGICALFRLPIP